MNNAEKLERLRLLQTEVNTIRKELDISRPGMVLYQSPTLDDAVVIVEADGFGGATTCVVEGNYPIDYLTKAEKHFLSELDAAKVADQLAAVGSHSFVLLECE